MKKLINGRTEEEILNDFYELVIEKEWFSWINESYNSYHIELNVDDMLNDDFEEFARGSINFDSEEELQDNMRDMYRSAGL